jgi:threonine/homoserine/homoserine lactone efflux protein
VLQFILLGSAIGLFSGAVPGPFSALIATTALRHGFWAGFRIGVVPLVTETVVMGLTALLISQLPVAVLRWIGIIGGLFILYLALRTWRESRDPREEGQSAGEATRSTLEAMTLAVLSPTPWAFWLFVGSPLLLAAWTESWTHASAFLGSFLFFLVGVHMAIAGLAGFGHQRLSRSWKKRVLAAASVALVVAGCVLIWQSWVGNFQEMVQETEGVRSMVDSVTGG